MRDGDRTAGLDLRLELRDHRAVGRQHIAEPNRDQPHLRPARRAGDEIGIERLAVHLGHALGRAQNGDRLDRLVGRDHDHGGGAGRGCRIGDVDRTKHVGAHALAPVALEQRHVLERSGVEHEVRLELGNEAEHAVAVADVGETSVDLGRGAFPIERF